MRGRTFATAKGQPDAIGQLERAFGLLARLGLPLETARARLELAAGLAKRQPEIAVAEAGSALTIFEELGAAAASENSKKGPRAASWATRFFQKGGRLRSPRGLPKGVRHIIGFGNTAVWISRALADGSFAP